MRKIRDYRVKINQAQEKWFDSDEMRARIYAPTGSGKTEMFLDLIRYARDLNSKAQILVVHPRLALSSDQQKRFNKAFRGESIEFTAVHSGTIVNTTGGKRQNKAVNSAEKLEEIRETARGVHVTFTSYKSLRKIAHLDFDLIICDEAHYTVEKQYRENLFRFQSKTIFYTATPVGVEGDEDMTMDNKDYYGGLIAEIEPKVLIEKGYMVAPRLRFAEIQTKEGEEETFIQPAETISYVFSDQRDQINTKLKHKMLVAMPNTLMFEEIMNKLSDIRRIIEKDVDVYYVTAGEHVKNGKPFSSREELLEDFAANDNESIIIHCDTLAEGIDIDGLTGAFMMRSLSKRKFGQTIGRCARPYKKDLDKDGEVRNMKRRLKPNSIITVPVVNGQPYFKDVKEFIDTFTLYGYGDIMDYIDPEFIPATGGSDDEEREDDNCMFANILDIRVKEKSLEINELLFNNLFGE